MSSDCSGCKTVRLFLFFSSEKASRWGTEWIKSRRLSERIHSLQHLINFYFQLRWRNERFKLHYLINIRGHPGQVLSPSQPHKGDQQLFTASNNFQLPGNLMWFWAVGGYWSSQRKTMHEQEEHVNLTQTGRETNCPLPSWEATVLTAAPQCCPVFSVLLQSKSDGPGWISLSVTALSWLDSVQLVEHPVLKLWTCCWSPNNQPVFMQTPQHYRNQSKPGKQQLAHS